MAQSIISNLPSTVNYFDHRVNIQKMLRNGGYLTRSFSFQQVSTVKVREAIDRLKRKSSKDIYDMDVGLIVYLKNTLISPLTKLINSSIKEGIYPSCFKLSKVIPVFKKGDTQDPNNYRPISLIPILSKIFEYILKDQLYTYFENNQLFTRSQYGFRSGGSTALAILRVLEGIAGAFDEGLYMDAIFCDLSKAFDCVSHDILLEKLSAYGVDNGGLRLLGSYLSDREQVTFFKTNSSKAKILYGVPQGSLLAPLLFLIYINDINMAVPNSEVVLFADDTTVFHCSTDLNTLMAKTADSIDRLNEWFLLNKLSLNKEKTAKMTFTLRTLNNENPIELKFLGIHLDQTLTFEKHIDFLASRLSKTIFLLRNLKHIVPFSVCQRAFHGLFQSICCYALLTWGHSSQSKRVFGLQRRAVRVLSGLHYRADVKNKFVELRIMTLPSRYIYESLIYTYQNLSKYQQHTDLHAHNTRHASDLLIPFQRVYKSRFAFNYYGPKFFNVLPDNIRRLPINNFKRICRDVLLRKAYYNLDDFLADKPF